MHGILWGFLLLVGWMPPVCADSGEIRLTTGQYPPLISAGIPNKGVVLHLVTTAFANAGIKVQYIFLPWARSYEMAKNAEADGSAVWTPTPEREKHFYFSDPIIENKKVFFHQKDLRFKWKTFADFKGLRIGTTRSYAYAPDFRQSMSQAGAELIDADSDLINFRLLLDKRIDLHPNNQYVGEFLLKNHFTAKMAARVTHCDKAFAINQLSVIWPKSKKGSHKYAQIFNHELRRMRHSGKYDEIMAKFRLSYGKDHLTSTHP